MFQYEERDEENMSLDGNYAAEVDNFEFNISEAPESIRSDSEPPQPASEPEEPFSNNGSLTYHRDFSVNALLIRMGRRDLIATPVPWDIAMDPVKRTDLERIERLKRMDRNEIVYPKKLSDLDERMFWTPSKRARMNAGYLRNHIMNLHLALDNDPNADNEDPDVAPLLNEPIPHPLSKMRMFPLSGEGALPKGAQHRLDLWRPPGWSGNN